MPVTGFKKILFMPPAVVVAAATTTWDLANKTTNISLSGTPLLIATATAGGNEEVRAVASRATGKFYFSVLASSGSTILAIVNASYVLGTNNPAAQANAISVHPVGTLFYNGGGIGAWSGFVAGDRVDVAVDIGGQLIWARANNGVWNSGGGADPATGTGGASFAATASGPFYPEVWLGANGAVGTAEFGPTYTNAPPASFGNW